MWKGTYRENDVAIKKLRFHRRNTAEANQSLMSQEFKREISTLLKVRHTNLVNFVGVSIKQSTEKKIGKVLILTEYCFGDNLFTLLHEKQSLKLSYKQCYKMALDIAKGMNYLHTNEPPILHRDLKSLNLLL